MSVPTQKDWITGRFRRIKAPEPSEFQTQSSIVEYIRLMARAPTIVFAVPNGELRDKRTAAKLKAAGVMPGVADLVLIRQAPWASGREPQVLFLEVKTRSGRLSEHQESFRDMVGPLGCEYGVVRSLDDAIEFLEKRLWLRPRQADGRI